MSEISAADKALRKAQQNSFDLLVNCILKRGLLNEATEGILCEIGEAFQLPLSVEPAHKRIIFKRDENGTPISITRRRSLRNLQDLDCHREECEVCDKGGDLLCCDNCSLVYHLQCVRVRLNNIPEGEWFCPYCLHAKIGDQFTQMALRQMKLIQQICRVSNSSPTENSFFKAPESSNKEVFGLPCHLDESLVICRGGGRFQVKKNPRHSLSTSTVQQEISRHWTLEEALQKIKEISAIENKKHDDIEESSSHTNSGSPRLSKSRQDSYEVTTSNAVCCPQCLDDPRILCCCFCGCKVCFGKHDPNSLQRCSGCESQYHHYCLEPPLGRPSDEPWFCAFCQANPHLQRSVLTELERQKSQSTSTTSSEGGEPQQPARRGRGRPPGSSRFRPKRTIKERKKELKEKSSHNDSIHSTAKSKQSTVDKKVDGNLTSSLAQISAALLEANSKQSNSQQEVTGKKDHHKNQAVHVSSSDAHESTEQSKSASVTVAASSTAATTATTTTTTATTTTPLKRRPSISLPAQTQPIFAPMNLENTLESFQIILEKGGSRYQLSLRETARIDVATTQYNIFKEWAPGKDIQKLLDELVRCRTDLLERLKAKDPVRFAKLPPSKYTSLIKKKRKFGEFGSESNSTGEVPPSSSEGEGDWSFSEDDESNDDDDFDDDKVGGVGGGELRNSSGVTVGTMDLPGRLYSSAIPSHPDVRSLPGRSFLKQEDTSVPQRPAHVNKSSLADIHPRKYSGEKNQSSRYSLSGTAAALAASVMSQNSLDVSALGSSSTISRAMPGPSQSRTNKQRALLQVEKQRQQRYAQHKHVLAGQNQTMNRNPNPMFASANSSSAPTSSSSPSVNSAVSPVTSTTTASLSLSSSSASTTLPSSSPSSLTSSSATTSLPTNSNLMRASTTPTSSQSVSGGVGSSPQSLEDYIRFSMLVSLSQQHDATSQPPLTTPLPPPADADNRYHTHAPSFGPPEGLLLSSGSSTTGLVPMRGNLILPSHSGIPPVSTSATSTVQGQVQGQSQSQAPALSPSQSSTSPSLPVPPTPPGK